MGGTGKSPELYQVEDFIADESFVNYCFRLDEEDYAFWEKWLLTNPGSAESVEAAKDILRSLTLRLTDEEMAAETAKIKAAIGFEGPGESTRRPVILRLLQFGGGKRLSRTKRRTKVILPSLLILLTGGYLGYRMLSHSERMVEKFNRSSDPVVLTLPDGTTVTLAPQSVLRYSSGFGEKDRTVALNGEAQFEVSRKMDQPFEVQESDLLVTVLGTKFTVKKKSGNSEVLVELMKGKLKVENTNSSGLPQKSIILNPDERVVYNRQDQRLYKETWQPQADLSAQVRHILFQRNTFPELAEKIRSVFGVTVINQSKKKNWMFSGEFENATVQDIVKNICVVERLDFRMNGDTILIK